MLTPEPVLMQETGMFDIENKISRLAANPAWRTGRREKKNVKSDTEGD